MDINKYISKHSTQSEFAQAIGASPSMVYQWLNKLRPISAKYCVAIEQKTNGLVTRKELRPNDWDKIWPELN